MTGYFHESNPWKDRLVYVPIDELAAVLADEAGRDGNTYYLGKSATEIIEIWETAGEILDAYILPGKSNSIGIRYGVEPDQYLSVYNSNEVGISELIERHAVARMAGSAAPSI